MEWLSLSQCHSLHNVLKFLKLYSPPPSHLIVLIFFLIWYFIKALKTLSLSSTLNLILMVWKNVFLEKFSMKVRNSLAPPWNVAMGSHKSMCKSPIISFAWEPPLKGNGVQWCFPYTHPSHKLKPWSLLRSMPSTRSFISIFVKDCT